MLPTLHTKLAIPPARVNLVARPRLISNLTRGLTCPVTLITAPAGFGKTTLFSEWRATQPDSGLPVAWLSLDPSDNTPVRLWTYIVAALKTIPAMAARAGFGADTLAVLEGSPHPPVDQYLTPLLNDIAGCDAAFALVLDDYYLVAGPEINAALGFMLEHLPPSMRLVLLTRAEPDLPFGRLRAGGQLCELRADDLRFTLSEAAAFLNQAMACDLSDEEITLLQQRTEGWAAGLQMAALSLRGREDRRAVIASFAGDQRHIADYFVEEVLARQPKAVQTFLEQTSILDRLSGPLCDAVTGKPGSQAMLERIEQANLFLVPLDDERHWYRYHRLLSDLLRARLERTQSESVTALHARASHWFEQEGSTLEAAGHALAAKDYERVVDLSEQNALDWWAAASRVFVNPANFVPADVIANRPNLCILRGWGNVIQGQLDESSQMFDRAEHALLGRPGDAPAMLGFIALARKYIAALYGLPCEITESDLRMQSEIPETSVAMRNCVDSMLSYILFMDGDLDHAAPPLLAAVERDLRRNSTSSVAPCTSRLARLRLIQGRLVETEVLLRKYIASIADRGSQRFYVHGSLHAALADVLRERNDLTEASREADEGINCNETWGIPNATTQAYQAKARVLAAMGDDDGALALLDHEERLCSGRVTPSDLADERQALRIELWLARGDLAAAERWMRDSGLTPEDPLSFRREREHLVLARVLLATGQFGAAIALLTRLVAAASAGGRNGRLIEALVLLSSAQAETNANLAVTTLKRALALAEPEGHVRAFIAPGEPVARLLRLIAVEGRATGKYAQRILNPGAHAVETGESDSSLAEPLSGRELEVLGLLAAGMSNRDIAAALTLTIGTVKTHVHSILGKLDATSRTQAIARARERGLLGD